MQITLEEVLSWCVDNWKLIVTILGLFVEFTPAIKVSPIRAILRWIGKAINGEVLQRIEGLEKRADEQRRSIDVNEMDRIRWEIFDFANECRNGVRHTKDEFQHIIDLNTKYHNLLDKYGEENGVFDAEYAYIFDLYKKCQRENSFL